jgi:tetratricopeptide (TPR) repeat protein
MKTLLICVLLAAGTVLAYWGVRNAEFISIDDSQYLVDNIIVQRGLSVENVKWAFTTYHHSNWHPVTWLSWMVDCELFGLNAAAMHKVNIALHVANVLLLFLLLKRLTGAAWASAMVAALFAVHPLHVESVAWIAERKDVLSTLFWILTMGAYAEYARRRCAGWYVAALVFFALGLMAKAMLVTLPFVLLLIDFWPLQRMEADGALKYGKLRGLLVEKIPFFALAAVCGWLTFLAQREGRSVASFERLPLGARIENAIVSYARYLEKTFWPTDLAIYYPHPGDWSDTQVTGAFLLLVAVSVFVVLMIRQRPYLFVGWCWFMGTLVPVIGVLQVGGQSMADRYTYVPHIGLFVAIVWAIRELVTERRRAQFVAIGIGAAVCITLGAVTYRQAGYWKDNLTVLSHAERITPPHPVVWNNLGDALLQHGRAEEALTKFKKVLEINPGDEMALGNIGNVYWRQGKLVEAIEQYREALRHQPNSALLSYNLGLALGRSGDLHGAVEHYRQALRLNPLHLGARLNLGNAHLALGEPDAAITNYLAIIQLKPNDTRAHYNLGNVYRAQGRLDEAIKHYSQAARIDQQSVDARHRLAAVLQQAGRQSEALKHLQEAVALDPGDVATRGELAALLASMGQAEPAIAHYREGLRRAPDAAPILNNLAWMLATHPNPQLRDGPEAVRLAERAVELSKGNEALFVGTLAAAYAEAGQFENAIKTAQEAIQVAEQNSQKEVASKNRDLLATYRQQRAWREPAVGP